MPTTKDIIPDNFDAARRRIIETARSMPKRPPKRHAADPSAYVDRLTADDIRAALKVWQETRDVPGHVKTGKDAYVARLVETLNAPSAWLILPASP